jgi:multiple sugar transport system ATP-binding protein
VILGLRPEHIHASAGRLNSSKAKVKAHVEVVEPMGNEVYVYVTTTRGNHPSVARFSPERVPKVGSSIPLYFDLSKALFFDKESERVL